MKPTRYLPMGGFALGCKERECLKCRKDFCSTGPGNRICPRCSHINSQQKGGRFTPPPVNFNRKEVEGP